MRTLVASAALAALLLGTLLIKATAAQEAAVDDAEQDRRISIGTKAPMTLLYTPGHYSTSDTQGCFFCRGPASTPTRAWRARG